MEDVIIFPNGFKLLKSGVGIARPISKPLYTSVYSLPSLYVFYFLYLASKI